MMGRTRARLNAVQSGRFEVDLATFVAEVGPRTHYLRDVPAEFFAWVVPRWREDGTIPAYLVDLAAYELTDFQVAAAASARDQETVSEIALDRPVTFAESARLLRFEWAIHEWHEDTEVAPARRDVHLLACYYRDDAHAVRRLEPTPLARSLIRPPCSPANRSAMPWKPPAPGDVTARAVLSEMAQLLADLGQRGVILGARWSAKGT